jgi:hypothetical protein
MLKRILALLAVLCAIGALQNRAAAQARDGWVVDLEPMWMNVKGFDQHGGDVVRSTTVITTSPLLLSDTRTREPIMNRMDAGLKFRGAIQYRRQGWGAGASGWSYSSESAINGTVTSIGSAGGLIFGSNSVSMWRETLDPVENDLEPSGLSPVDFHSNAALKTYTFDVFAFRSVTGDANPNRIDVIVGAKTGRMKTTQNQGFTERAFVFDFFQTGVHLNNVITLGTNAQANFVGTGPLIGIQGQTRLRRLGISGGITGSFLIGNARQQGVMTDTDEIGISRSASGSPVQPCPINFAPDGCLPIHSEIHFSTSPIVFVPVSEFRLRLQFDLSNHLSLSGQGFTAIWGNVPIPPTFTMTHAFAAGSASPGLDWALQQQTLRFAGAGIALSVHFE